MLPSITKAAIVGQLSAGALGIKIPRQHHDGDTGEDTRGTRNPYGERDTPLCSFEQYGSFRLQSCAGNGNLKFPNIARRSRSLRSSQGSRNVGFFCFCKQIFHRSKLWLLILAEHVPDWVTTGRLCNGRGACFRLFSFNPQSQNIAGAA